MNTYKITQCSQGGKRTIPIIVTAWTKRQALRKYLKRHVVHYDPRMKLETSGGRHYDVHLGAGWMGRTKFIEIPF